MLNSTQERMKELKNNFIGKKIAVIGDMMVDAYFWGDVKRISPEAPVPVVEIDDEFFRFGGASNVAYNILKLGGTPIPIGIIGDDNDGIIFNKLMDAAGIRSDGIIVDQSRPTTIKTRVIAGNQQVVRIDKESKKKINEITESKIKEFFLNEIDSIDAVILQDYNKGVLTASLIEFIIEESNKRDKIITVDPKFENFFQYKNVTVFKPNRKETEDAFGIKIKTAEEVKEAGNKLLEKLNSKFVLLTLGSDGMIIFEKDNEEKRFPTKARNVADVSGAGDTVISTLTMALAARAEIHEAAYLANYAGGLVCEEVGIVPIEIDKLFEIVNSKVK